MKRNRLSRPAHSAANSRVNLCGSLPRFSAVATLFHNPLALLRGLFLCLAPAAASAQGVTLQSGSTNLGSANVCPIGQTTPAPCSNTVTLTYNVDAGTTIGGVGIFTTGAKNLDFQAEANDTSTTLCSARTYSSATTCTLDVTFAPIAPGQRSGAAEILDVGGNLLATTKIYGTGVGPAITFQPGTQTTLGSGFEAPSGVAVDGSGNIFVVDVNALSERLAEDGYTTAISLVDLNNRPDSPPFPSGVALDGSGDVFLADGPDSFVSELLAVNGDVPPNQQLIFLGGSYMWPGGVAVDAKGNVFVANAGFSAVQEILAVNGSIPANPTINTLPNGSIYPNSIFNFPEGVAVDAKGNVFVSDGNAVYEILAAGGYVTVNTLGSGFENASGAAVDAAGDVFVADQGNGKNGEVKEMLAVNGSIPANPTIVALGEHFSGPASLAVDGSENVYVADLSKNRIIKLDFADPPTFTFASTAVGRTSSSKSVRFQNVGNTTLTGSGVLSDTADFTVVHGPGIVPDCTAGTLLLAPGAECNLSIAFIPQSAGPLSATLTLSDNALNGHPATQTIQLSGMGGCATPCTQTIAFRPIPDQYAGTSLNLAAYASASSGLPLTFTSLTPGICSALGASASFVAAGTCTIQASQPGNPSYSAAMPVSQNVLVYPAQGISFAYAQTSWIIPPTPGLAVDSRGNIYFADKKTVKEITAVNGSIPANPMIETVASGFKVPLGVAVDKSGNLYVVDFDLGILEVLAVDGVIPAKPTIKTLGSGFYLPTGVAVDANGDVFVGDTYNSAVKEILAVDGSIPADPTIRTLGSGFANPRGVAVDAAGNVFVEDAGNSGDVVKEILAVDGSIPANPTIRTLSSGFDGGIAVDAKGDVFVSSELDSFVSELVAVNGRIPTNPTIDALGSGFAIPIPIAVDKKGNVFAADDTVTDNAGDGLIAELQLGSVNFGSANVCAGQTTPAPCSNTITLTYNVAAGTTLGGVNIFTAGGQNLDFQAEANDTSTTLCSAQTYSSATTCTVDVTFAPLAPDLRKGTVQIVDGGSNILATTSIYGTGHHANQTIDFPTISAQTALTPLDHLYATASSGLPITFTSNTPDVCTISGIRADFLTAGSCDIIATQAGNSEYFSAITGQTFLVHHRRQVITFDPIAPQPVDTMLTLTATTDSGLTITYASTTPTVCSVSGSTASLLNTGTCTIQASQAGDATYFPHGPKTQSFTVE